jgi:FkbM family methyltransferase
MPTARSFYRRLRHAVQCAAGRDVRFPVEIRVPMVRHGSEYGGWWICPTGISADSVVYSFGIGTDITFDRSLIDTYGLTVDAFDPTPSSIAWLKAQPLPRQFSWQELGIAAYDGRATFFPPADPTHVSHSVVKPAEPGRQGIDVEVRRLSTIMASLGDGRVDILKLDIEGAEYEVLDDILAAGVRPGQLLVEFHHRMPGIGVERTRRAVAGLKAAGYRIFSVSDTGEEYGFIRPA